MRSRTYEDGRDQQGKNGECYGGPEPPTETAKECIGRVGPTPRSRCRGGDHGWLAVEVRDALRSAAFANTSPGRLRSDVAGRTFGELPLVVGFGEGAEPGLVGGNGGVKGALGVILADVVVAASRATWARMKICAAEDCRWACYDHSRSRTGRWCAMETCGNRHKTRRYRRRRRGGVWQGG